MEVVRKYRPKLSIGAKSERNGGEIKAKHQEAMGTQWQGAMGATSGSNIRPHWERKWRAMGTQARGGQWPQWERDIRTQWYRVQGATGAQNQSATGAIPERNWRKIRVQHQSAMGHDQSEMGAQWGAISERNENAIGAHWERNHAVMRAMRCPP